MKTNINLIKWLLRRERVTSVLKKDLTRFEVWPFALGFNIVLFGAILFGTPTQEDYKKSPNPRWAASFIEDDGEEKAHAAH
eukprot:CAMPEP_0185830088 /NCGR_PEP_ID=MMETSP1353-20130828/620_1 /TAXON_ID=1077150 /ORGANISM="Erythrolobus australicus, Strain CCMP3124" /LENGTH=80 /DNA_ID=CAMNT_0028527945 /DNA_START=53 /DNA_END=295 /DNA_ORIENTATION=-